MGVFGLPIKWKRLAEYLKTKYDLEIFQSTLDGGQRILVDFTGTIEITIDDFKQVYKEMYGHLPSLEILLREFGTLQQSIIDNLSSARVIEHKLHERTVIEDVVKAVSICVRVTYEEKKRLEQEALKNNMSLSDYIRARLSLS